MLFEPPFLLYTAPAGALTFLPELPIEAAAAYSAALAQDMEVDHRP